MTATPQTLEDLAKRALTNRLFCGDENHRALAAGVLSLLAEGEALRQDALRYRFVRNPIGTSSPLAIWNEGKMPLFSGMADAVIDEFMAKEATQ